jgi:hypothetical protein
MTPLPDRGISGPLGAAGPQHVRSRTVRRYGLAMRGFATVDMNASPEAVWLLISDVTQIGRFSPETFEAQWLEGAVGPVVGAKFRGHVKRNEKGPIYWTACTVTECDPGRVFGFAVRSRPLGFLSRRATRCR